MTDFGRYGDELARLRHRPSDPPPVLSMFDVAAVVAPNVYVARMKKVMDAALQTASLTDFEVDQIGEDLIPRWFTQIEASVESRAGDELSNRGARRYMDAYGQDPWSTQEWLFALDPDLRAWSWWDTTVGADSHVHVWVDARGESLFPCDEIRWLAYVCGADRVTGPDLRESERWAAEAN